MLLEINWSSGRLVREFFFLLDPPEVATTGPAPVAAPVANGTCENGCETSGCGPGSACRRGERTGCQKQSPTVCKTEGC